MVHLRRRQFLILAAWPNTVALAIVVTGSEPIKAHDIYSALRDRAGVSCCNEQDCRPARYRFTPAGVQMLVNGEWILVPDETIQYRTLEGDTGETAGGHWCGTTGLGTLTHCAILPPSSADSTQTKSWRHNLPASPHWPTR
jgi:hypothetical protein